MMEYWQRCLRGFHLCFLQHLPSKQLRGREKSVICLKGSDSQSIGFSLQLCFHTAALAGYRALTNDTLTFPSPSPSHPLRRSLALLRSVIPMSREHQDEFGHWGPNPLRWHFPSQQLSSLSFWISVFVKVSQGRNNGRYDLPESCTYCIIP